MYVKIKMSKTIIIICSYLTVKLVHVNKVVW